MAAAIGRGDHGSTFGGNPLICQAALVILDRVSDPGFLATVLSNHVRGYDDMLRLSFSQEAGENHFAFYLPTHKATYRALGARSIQNISCALYDIYDSKDYRSDGVGSGVDRVDDTANNVMRDIHRTNHDLPWRALLTLEEAWVRHLDRLGWEGDEVLRMNGIDPNF